MIFVYDRVSYIVEYIKCDRFGCDDVLRILRIFPSSSLVAIRPLFRIKLAVSEYGARTTNRTSWKTHECGNFPRTNYSTHMIVHLFKARNN